MTIGRVGKWNQNSGQRKGGELSQTSRAGSRNKEIGSAVNFFHPMMESSYVSREIFSAIIICNQAFIARAGKMDHLQRRTLQERQRFDQRLINSARTLAASHHEQRGEILLQSKPSTRIASIQMHQFGPDWCAGDFCMRFWEKGCAFLKTKHDRVHHPCC